MFHILLNPLQINILYVLGSIMNSLRTSFTSSNTGWMYSNIQPHRFASYIGGQRLHSDNNVDLVHAAAIRKKCSFPGCLGMFCTQSCQYLAMDIEKGIAPEYTDLGNATHSKKAEAKDSRILETRKLGYPDMNGDSRWQYIAIFKDPLDIPQEAFDEHNKFNEYLNKNDSKFAKVLHELVKDKL